MKLPCGVVEDGDSHVIVSEAVFELFGNLGQHFIGIQRGDGVARNKIQKIQMARLGAFFLEEAGVLNGDTGFAGEDSEKLQVAFVESTVLIGEDTESTNRVIVGDERDATERAGGAQWVDAKFSDFGDEILADQNRLACTQDVFGDVIASGTRALGHAHAFNHFQLKLNGVAQGIGSCRDRDCPHQRGGEALPRFCEGDPPD